MSSDFLSKKFGWRGGERWEVTEAALGSGSQCARESLEMLVCDRQRPCGVAGVIYQDVYLSRQES